MSLILSPVSLNCRLGCFCRKKNTSSRGVLHGYKTKIRPASLPINKFTVVRQDGSSPQSGTPLNEAINLKNRELNISLDISAERFVIDKPSEFLSQECA